MNEKNKQFLTTIDNKVQKGQDLTKEELRFLYVIDDEMAELGYWKDPRIEEIKSKRDAVVDLNKVFEGVKIFKGNLDLRSLTSAEGLTFPECIAGDLFLNSLTSVKGLKLPKQIRGLVLNSLTSAEGLNWPESIDGLWLNSLTSAKGLHLPEWMIFLNLNSLTSAEDLKLPKEIAWDLCLDSLTSAEGLNLPEHVGRDLYLNGLTSAEGLNLPKYIGGYLHLNGLTSAEGLNLPKYIGGYLHLNGLTSAEGLNLPERIGSLALDGLTSAKGLNLPKYIVGYLDLNGLTSAEGLKLPENFNIKQLVAPKHIIEEIKTHPEKYYIQEEKKEDLSEIKEQSVNIQHFTPNLLGEYVTFRKDNFLYVIGNFTDEWIKENYDQIFSEDELKNKLENGTTPLYGLNDVKVKITRDGIEVIGDVDDLRNHSKEVKKDEVLKDNKDNLSEVKEKVLNAKHFTEEQKAQIIDALEDDAEEVAEYRGKHFK